MTQPINPAVIGALVREGREAAGLTQTQLAERIGASRFWVAAFEKGKPSAEMGLALKAIQALGMSIRILPEQDTSTEQASGPGRDPSAIRSGHELLATVIATATLGHAAPSQVTGWPGAIPPTTRSMDIAEIHEIASGHTAADVVWQAMTALGGARSISEVRDWTSVRYPGLWKDIGTTMADLVWHGNGSSAYAPEQQFLERVETGVYRIRQSGRFRVGGA